MKTINVGIIGTGGIATGRHLPALAKQNDIKVIAVCDVVEDSAKKAAEKFDVPNIFSDYKKMLEMDELDAVQVCTPNFLHKQPTIDSLNAGKHVMVEKPIARNAAEGVEMLNAAKASGKKFMVAQCFRYTSEAQCVKRFIDAGELGDIYYARAWALRRRGIPTWGVFTDKEKQGGGPLIDIGVHVLDLALYLMGNPKPVAVLGSAYTKIGNTPGHIGHYGNWDHKKYSVEDFGSGFIKLDNGASISLESSFAANIVEDRMNCSVLGSKGGAETNPLKITGEKLQAVYDMTPVKYSQFDMYETEIRGFYDAIHNDTEVPVTGEQALDVIKIIDAIYESSKTGREVLIK